MEEERVEAWLCHVGTGRVFIMLTGLIVNCAALIANS